jgi:AcrR family transcriptional regulator
MVAPIRTPRHSWIVAGLEQLAAGGPDAVRIEPLAKRLGVTKGGFYGHFEDRAAFLDALLDAWESTSGEDVVAEVEGDGGGPRERILRAGALTFSSALLPVDLAVRDWARHDATVAERLRRVDGARMDYLREQFATFCDDEDEVEARATLAFCLAIGVHVLSTDHGGRSRFDVVERAGRLLVT